jgi:hypothetical protein
MTLRLSLLNCTFIEADRSQSCSYLFGIELLRVSHLNRSRGFLLPLALMTTFLKVLALRILIVSCL